MKYLFFITLAFVITGCTSPNKETSSNLCDININKINDYNAQSGLTTGEPERTQLEMLYKQAQAYKAANKIENCISTSEQALSIINNISNNN